jgi:hypothetical protein
MKAMSNKEEEERRMRMSQSGIKAGQTEPPGGKTMPATAEAAGKRQVEPARSGHNNDSRWREI